MQARNVKKIVPAKNYKKTSRNVNKKFELMIRRRAKVYSSSSCSQTVSLSPTISSQFILGVYAAAEDRKNQ